MRFVGSSKVSKLVPKPDVAYPLIRLPQRYKTVIGKTAHIYESSDEGQKAIVLVFDEAEKKKKKKKEKLKKPVIKKTLNLIFGSIEVLRKKKETYEPLLKRSPLNSILKKQMGSAEFESATFAV